jgi:hypothetical protein
MPVLGQTNFTKASCGNIAAISKYITIAKQGLIGQYGK